MNLLHDSSVMTVRKTVSMNNFVPLFDNFNKKIFDYFSNLIP